jgi:hypothetical protein
MEVKMNRKLFTIITEKCHRQLPRSVQQLYDYNVNELVYYKPKRDLTYEHVVNIYIREKYTLDDELAILRQREFKVDEYKEYYDYVESCKHNALMFIKYVESYYKNKE